MNEIDLELDKILSQELEKMEELKGIIVATRDGILIVEKIRNELKLPPNNVVAVIAGLVNLSLNVVDTSIEKDCIYHVVNGKNVIFLSSSNESIIVVEYFDNKAINYEDLAQYMKKLKQLTSTITLTVELSRYIREDIFEIIKKTIPDIKIIAIVSTDGIPLRIHLALSRAELEISGLFSAIYHYSKILVDSEMQYSVTIGENDDLIMKKLDENRILSVMVPHTGKKSLEHALTKVNAIIGLKHSKH